MSETPIFVRSRHDELFSIPATRAAIECAELLGCVPATVDDARRADVVMGRAWL